jgi:hypothetical protein
MAVLLLEVRFVSYGFSLSRPIISAFSIMVTCCIAVLASLVLLPQQP